MRSRWSMSKREPRGCPCDDGDGEGCPVHGIGAPDSRPSAAEQPGAAEASPWRSSPPTVDEIHSGSIHWWVQPSGNVPWPVELLARGDMIIEAKSGLPIKRRQLEGAWWAPCVPPTQIVGFIPTAADCITLGRIHDGAPPLHVGDLAQRLVKRILSVACPVQSNECAIRGMCTNKCGALNRCE